MTDDEAIKQFNDLFDYSKPVCEANKRDYAETVCERVLELAKLGAAVNRMPGNWHLVHVQYPKNSTLANVWVVERPLREGERDKLCNALGLEDEALAVLEENKPSNGDNMITTLKGFTDKKLQRHYYPEHEEWEVSECSNQIKFDMAGQAEIFIDRDEAADLAKLFADFAKHGTFRVPRNQEPSKTSNGE